MQNNQTPLNEEEFSNSNISNNLNNSNEEKNSKEHYKQISTQISDRENNTTEVLEEKQEDKNKKQKKSLKQDFNDLKNKIKNTFKSLIISKARKKLQINTLFETVSDANTIFKVERKIGDYLILIAGFFFVLSLIEFILILTLFPLKEKEPYLVTFATSTQNFALVQKADSKITANSALVRQLLGAYILNRESLNRIDDQERFEVIREQSDSKVWKTFENIIAKQNSIYTNNNLTRDIKIINIATIKKGYANADVSISLYALGILQSEKRYRIIVAYKFEPITIDFSSMPKNPTGFIVTGYSITEIATIKALDPKNQVKEPEKIPSKIKYKDKTKKTDSDNTLSDDGEYQYQDNYQNNKSNENNQNLNEDSNPNQDFNIQKDDNSYNYNNSSNDYLNNSLNNNPNQSNSNTEYTNHNNIDSNNADYINSNSYNQTNQNPISNNIQEYPNPTKKEYQNNQDSKNNINRNPISNNTNEVPNTNINPSIKNTQATQKIKKQGRSDVNPLNKNSIPSPFREDNR